MKGAILLGIILCALTAVSQENDEHYVVAKGDSAAAICREFHISMEQLLASNPGLNVERLWVGQRVRIPKKGDSTIPANVETNSRADTTAQPSQSAVKEIASRETSPMYPITANDKAFLERIQKAALTNDVEWLAGVILYPITLKQSGGSVTLKNSDDFKTYSSAILTPYLKSAVQNQSPDSLFKNWRGVMIGNGAIWFELIEEETDKGGKWVHRIIGINPEDRSPPKAQEK